MGLPEDELDNVMHVSLPIGSATLMGSDVPSTFGMPHEPGNNFSVSVSPASRDEADSLFAKLSDGGPSRYADGRYVLGILLRRLR